MSGEELKSKLKGTGLSLAEIARRMGVIPQSVVQALEAKDIKTGFLEEVCRVIDKDMSFFYGGTASTSEEDNNEVIATLRKELESLRQENDLLKAELRHQSDPDKSTKESQVYELWMEHMKIEKMRSDFDNRMQEMYQKILEG